MTRPLFIIKSFHWPFVTISAHSAVATGCIPASPEADWGHLHPKENVFTWKMEVKWCFPATSGTERVPHSGARLQKLPLRVLDPVLLLLLPLPGKSHMDISWHQREVLFCYPAAALVQVNVCSWCANSGCRWVDFWWDLWCFCLKLGNKSIHDKSVVLNDKFYLPPAKKREKC